MGLNSPKKTIPQLRAQSTSNLHQCNAVTMYENASATTTGRVQHSPKNLNKSNEKSAACANLVIPPFNANVNLYAEKIASTANLSTTTTLININENNTETANNNDLGQCNEQKLIQTGLDRYITVQSKRKRSPRSAQFANRNKATRLEDGTSQIPIDNRFSDLEIDFSDGEQIVKKEKPPPIYLREASNNELVTQIRSLTNSKFYIAPIRRGNINETKIQPFEIDGFRAVVNYFEEAKKRYYTYQLKSQKGLVVIIKGIESCVDVNDIIAALAEQGFKTKSIINIINREKVPQPMFRVELEPEENARTKGKHDIYNLKYLLYRKISIEEPKKRFGPVQCVNCQEYGHTKSYCTLNAVCVICGELHNSKQCEKTKNDPSVKRCSNCGENHTANYRGCPVYLDLKRKTHPKMRSEQRMLNQRYIAAKSSAVNPNTMYNVNLETIGSNQPPGISYANTMKGTSPKLNVQSSEEESNIHVTVNKLTETIQSFMMMMERQMSMMMQNMNTLMQIIVKNQK